MTNTGKTVWQLRAPYFDGAKRYKIALDDGRYLEFDADQFGLFELDDLDPSIPVAIFAKPLKRL
jgi:hypothetical protein